MLPEQTIHIVAFQQNLGTIRHKLGHPEAKMGDEFDFSVHDLSDGCNLLVKVICDYCGKEFTVPLGQRNYRLRTSPAHKDCCGDYACRALKKRDTSMARFGVANPQSLPEIKEKVASTCMQKYGVLATPQAPDVKKKIVDSLIRNNGIDYAKQRITRIKERALSEFGDPNYYWVNDESAAKRRQTCLDRYGVPNALQSDSVREKMQATVREKYGVDNVMFVQEIADKAVANRTYETIVNSKPELAMYARLLELGYDVRHGYYNLGYYYDCAVFVGDNRIDIEYDGAYWHSLHPERDERRDRRTVADGWKVIRFRGGNEVPSPEQLRAAINTALYQDQQVQVIELAG